LEIIGYISFIWVCVNIFDADVGVNMLSGGVFANYLPGVHRVARDILSPHLLSIAKMLFNLLLFSPALFLLYEKKSEIQKHLISRRLSMGVEQSGNFLATPSPISPKVFDIRFLVGTYFFMVIVLLCFI
jgi:hypothetical protein